MKSFVKIFVVFLLFPFLSCEYIQKRIDISSIKDMKQEIFADFQTGDPKRLKSFIDSIDTDDDTKPLFLDEIRISKRKSWSLKKVVKADLIEELISFPSLLSKDILGDSARFYTYRISDFKDSKTILWIPGFGVSDMAFHLIKNIFIEELKHGYNVVVYIPPYHLERRLPDKDDGVGFFSADMQKNLFTSFEQLREIRTINLFLKKQGVKEISSWGGSMGASTLLLSSKFTNYEHICLMIPLLDWHTAVFDSEYFKPLVDSLFVYGFDSLSIAGTLKKMSPENYQLPLKPGNMFVQYAKYDQLSSERVIQAFIKKNNITKVKSYNTSHATILLSRSVYKDYASFLDSVN